MNGANPGVPRPTVAVPRDSVLSRLKRRLWGNRPAAFIAPVLFVAFVYKFLLHSAMNSPTMAIVTGCLLIGVIGAGILGSEGASTALFIIAFALAPLGLLTVGVPFINVSDVAFIAAFCLALPRLLVNPLRIPSMFVVGSFIFAGFAILSLPHAAALSDSLTYTSRAIVALVFFPIAVAWLAPKERVLYWSLIAFGLGTAFSTLVGIPRHEFRNSGYTYHPIALAYTAMLALSFIPYIVGSKSNRGRWYFAIPITVVAFVGVWTSGSRTALIVLVALALLVPMLERSIGLGLVVAIGAVIVMPIIVSYRPQAGSTNALSRLFGTGGAEGSDNDRLFGLHSAWSQIQSNPILGNGYTIEHTYTIHNLYLQVLAAEGLIGLIGILLMLIALLVPLRRASSPQRLLAYPALAVVLAGPFSPNMTDHYIGLSLGLSLLVSSSLINRKKDAEQQAADLSHAALPSGDKTVQVTL